MKRPYGPLRAPRPLPPEGKSPPTAISGSARPTWVAPARPFYAEATTRLRRRPRESGVGNVPEPLPPGADNSTARGIPPGSEANLEIGSRSRPPSGAGNLAEKPRPSGRWFSKAERDRQLAPPKPVAPSQIAANIISRVDRQHPADKAIRDELRRAVGMPPDNAAWISRAVFNYYRWRGWLEGRAGEKSADLVSSVLDATVLAERFVQKAQTFSAEELVARVGPEWLPRELEVNVDLARAWQREPLLWLRCPPGRTAEVMAGLKDCAPGPVPDSLRYAASLDLFSTDLFHDGAFEIQDIASQAVAHLAAPQAGETWWDACAGEGGKTLHLGALMQGKGLVWASDRAEWRLKKLRVRAARAHCFNQRTVVWNDPLRPPTRTKFDGVLVDAPCAGLGTWGRNPHARWTTTPQDVAELSALQTQLLTTAALAVKPGGKLVYAACTLTRSETSDVAAAFTTAHRDFEPVLLTNPFVPQAAAEAPLFLWPQVTDGNGMFVAAWRRR